MTGSSSAVSRASGLRTERRRLRPAMISESGMSGLLGVSGEGEENVVEGGVADGKGRDQARVRVDLVQQGADLRRAAVGRDAGRQADRIAVHHAPPEIPADPSERA